MTPQQLRTALSDLNGERSVRMIFSHCPETLLISNALLIPEEADHVVKLTDGRKEYLIDVDRINWVEIG